MKYYSKKPLKKTVDIHKCNWLTKENNNKELVRIKCQGILLQICEGSHIIYQRARYPHALYEGFCVSLFTRQSVQACKWWEGLCGVEKSFVHLSLHTSSNTSYHGSIPEMHQCISMPTAELHRQFLRKNSATLWVL